MGFPQYARALMGGDRTRLIEDERTIACFRAFVVYWKERTVVRTELRLHHLGEVHRAQNGVMTMQEATSRKTLAQQSSHSLTETSKQKAPNSFPLNFKVSEEFRREFKTYAAQHNMKLNQLLFRAFQALKDTDAN